MTNEIGRVVAVSGFSVKIELDSAQRSPVRASIDGADTHIRINAFVTFDLGAGDSVLGTITNLYAREVYEPDDEELTLELARPRRLATAQLLGTIRTRQKGKTEFDAGISVLPTLDTPAIPATSDILAAVLESAPRRNANNEDEDGKLLIGKASAAVERSVFGSFNDLFSRPLAVVGNTGSGKSCTIAHLIQQAVRTHEPSCQRSRFFILDINGEYCTAFGTDEHDRQPNRLYINGEEATVPIWLMNAYEACQWLSASEQTQQPALINLWAIAKGAVSSADRGYIDIRHSLSLLGTIMSSINEEGGRKKGVAVQDAWEGLKQFVPWLEEDEATSEHYAAVESVFEDFNPGPRGWDQFDKSFGVEEKTLRDAFVGMMQAVEQRLAHAPSIIEQTADKPVYFKVSRLDNPAYLEEAAELSPGDRSIRQFLQGLRLRIQNRRSDKRWHSFYNYDDLGVTSAEKWLRLLGFGEQEAVDVCVIDCSMLAHDVLPYVCGIIGRMLLEMRECAKAESRFTDPWVVVLEEAHNYVKPRRQDESRGVEVSRETFERIAKEGRKFGLSLIVASQRPSDVSPTVFSQCANFITHRLQNPDDIEHFRKIVPSQSRRLLDQITILGAGEGIIVGSAFNVPARVQVQRPNPEPASQSSRPYKDWQPDSEAFDLADALRTWDVPVAVQADESDEAGSPQD